MAFPSASSATTMTQNGNQSVEYFLKQAYAAHRSKTKELEHQLELIKISKNESTPIPTCVQCEKLKASLDDLKKECDRQLDEKSKLIECLLSQLAVERDETDELVLESEKPLKRKRGVSWAPKDIDEASASTLELFKSKSDCQSPNFETFVSQQDVVLVPETLVDTQFDVYAVDNGHDKSDVMVVPETLPADVELLSVLTQHDSEENEMKLENKSFDKFVSSTKTMQIDTGNVDGKASTPAAAPRNEFNFETNHKRYRRTKYKQTTLTQNNVFAVASKNETVESPKEVDFDHVERGASPAEQQQNQQDSALDETFLPSPYFRKYKFEQGSATTPLTPDDATPSPDLIFNTPNLVVPYADSASDSTCSEDLLKQFEMKSPTTTAKQNESAIRKQLLETEDDFDNVPSKLSPKYKYKRETVRRQEDRRRIDGHECRDCERYFGAMDLTDEEKRERLKACSRHRSKHVAPNTPDHFWSVRFPTTQECKERGVLESTQNRPLHSRRRRQLQRQTASSLIL